MDERVTTRRSAFRALSIALTMAVLATVVGVSLPLRVASAATTPGALGYPYPNAPDCNEQTGAHCRADQWGFVQGQCHSWVAYRLNELNAAELAGTTFNDHWRMDPGDEWGSVWHWNTAATEAGVTMDDTPALGSVAWWGADGGHVAYVEAVYADGSVRISEMNADYHNGFDFARLRRSGRWPDAFLHIADRPAVPAAPRQVAATAGSRRATVTVTWKAPPSNGATVTGYVVTASPGGATVTVGARARHATVTHLASGSSYTFRVHATSNNGAGGDSHPSNSVVPTG
jgi:surface antigen